MSVWQYLAAVDGYVKANSTEKGLSQSEIDDIWGWLDGGKPTAAKRVEVDVVVRVDGLNAFAERYG